MKRRPAHDLSHPGSNPGLGIVLVATMIAGPLALLVALLLRRHAYTRPWRLAGLAILGLLVVAVLWPVATDHALQALTALSPATVDQDHRFRDASMNAIP